MSGTVAGGKKAAAANLANDPDFYRKIGSKGGKLGHTGGFAANPELARIAGAKGGRKSRRNRSADQAAPDQTPERTDFLLKRRISRAAEATS
ncbi:general stress protein [Arthrobacter sp. M-10]|uniref:general stress protein n=1 Tax=Arthrobacter sp. M-10 TaxID=3233037 RepID=UPI003F8DB653